MTYDDNYLNNADDIWNFYNNGMPQEITISSTAPACIFIVPQIIPKDKDPTLTIPVVSRTKTVAALIEYQNQGYTFSRNNTKRTISIHKRYLKDAKDNFINLVLKNRYPFIDDKSTVINALGDALNFQIDQHPDIFDEKIIGIDNKLLKIGLHLYWEGKLYKKYIGLNPYYNATKHPQNKTYKEKINRLNGPKGVKITIDFFETIRRIFKWYYKTIVGTIPDWDELKPNNYTVYDIYYRFSYNKRRI